MLGRFVVTIGLLGAAFFFGGVCLARLFRRNHADLARLYMADLVGAGAGVLAAVVLMNGVGTPSATFLCSLPVLVAALLACRGWSRAVPVVLLAGMIVLILFMLVKMQLLPARVVLGLLLVPLVVSFIALLLDTIALPLRMRGDIRLGRFLSRVLSPVYIAATRCLGLMGIPAPRIHRFFVRLNNRAVRIQTGMSRKSNVTILLPFCLHIYLQME